MSKEIPSKGERHATSTVFLVTNEEPRRVLLVHHKKFDKWMPPGGHQEKMENPYDAAIRETKEETGIDIVDYLPKPMQLSEGALSLPVPAYLLEERIDAKGDQPEHYHIDATYVVTVPHQEVTHQELESHAIGWFTQVEVEALPIFEDVALMIKAILL